LTSAAPDDPKLLETLRSSTAVSLIRSLSE
jgi:hypothetical protein